MKIHIIIFLTLILLITLNGSEAVRFNGDDKFNASSSLEKVRDVLTMVARVTNAISLEAGAIRKTLKLTDVVSEVLDIDPGKLDELLNLDSAGLNAHLEKMIHRYQKLTQDTEQFKDKLTKLKSLDEELTEAMKLNFDVSGDQIQQFFSDMTDSKSKSKINVCSSDIGIVKSFSTIINVTRTAMMEDIEKEVITNMTTIFV